MRDGTVEGARGRAVLRAFRHRNYQLYFGGQLISLTGTWMQSVAQSWLVYRLTGSAVLLGLASVGGAVADRRERHRILVVTQTCAMALALSLAALTLAGRVEVWHVFVFAAFNGVVNSFD